ncbi:unnamed protein product [Schistocephalus solidus]|uniref:Uncharacterized protein n=1 Tax=Schistocephalus solidus TaxID=70667 RepID=A0A183SAZ8_SCHSO|nr:unnamed protein product [Schistocephalus solidus]
MQHQTASHEAQRRATGNRKIIGETGKRLGTRLHEHQPAINRKDKSSLIYGHARQLNHDFTFVKTRVIGRTNEKMTKLVLESWSSTGTLNRAIDLHPAKQALRKRLGSVRPGPIRQASTRDREPTLMEKWRSGRRSHDQSQTLPHQCAHKTENNTREQQRLIRPLIDVGEANRHAAYPKPTTAPKGTEGTRARQRSPSGRSKEGRSERAGQSSSVHHGS